jgi:formate dehydrogenase subunit gamma
MTAPYSDERANEIIAAHSAGDGPLLPLLHALNNEFGHVPDAVVPLIAGALNLTRAEIHGVITFYHDFEREPPGRHVLKLCRAEACQAAGGDELCARVEKKLGIAVGETAPDKSVTLEEVFCLGLCAVGPAVMLDGRVVAHIDDRKFDKLMAEARS